MNVLSEIRSRFASALTELKIPAEDCLALIRPAQDTKFGDYQANFAMQLGKRLGKPPRDVAAEIVAAAKLDGLCEKVEVAGPGFINLTLATATIQQAVGEAFTSDRLGVPVASPTRTFVVDFSSPNVAKPMHVGHIRSTVIGDAISRILSFAGHRVVTDNHLGDWGTQFGMIIYGYRHFRDPVRWNENPVGHLGELYRTVRAVIDCQAARQKLPAVQRALADAERELESLTAKPVPPDAKLAKEHRKELERIKVRLGELREAAGEESNRIAAVESDPVLRQQADGHPDLAARVLEETAALHAGDEDNRSLWNEFLPWCREDIEKIYQRLAITFDHQLGESFYHDQLGAVVEDLGTKGLARESEGALCVFLDGFDTPMIVQKKDGAFLYSTTDLATIRYRMQVWKPDVVLYVVDHRQHEHFEKLFAAARLWGYERVQLVHVSFGTVLGDDGKPFKTRSGGTVGLEGLLDEAEERARAVLRDMNSPHLARLDAEGLEQIATTIGIGALKYADLSQNRLSDYKFSYDKMLELKGNTATYLQYLYARVQGVFREGDIDVASLRKIVPAFDLSTGVERQLAIQLFRLGETLDDVLVDYRPNLLAQYLFELAQQFFRFYDQCPVLKAEPESLRQSRLALCDLTARTVRQGLQLLGIGVVDRM